MLEEASVLSIELRRSVVSANMSLHIQQAIYTMGTPPN